MISFSFLRSFSNLIHWSDRKLLHLPSVTIHEIDTAQEKPARALKHLLKLNHANHAILWNDRKFHNHVPHVSQHSCLCVRMSLTVLDTRLLFSPGR